MTRDYQYNYSALKPSLFNSDKRIKKAETIARVCEDFAGANTLSGLHLLDVGSSNGIIDNHLANYFGQVTGIDIDDAAMEHAQKEFNRNNLRFLPGDAMQLAFGDNTFDVVVSTQIYEHVPDAGRMFDEIYRVLKPGGFCYFSGNNRMMLMEPHYRLPLLSVLPRSLAHHYLRLSGKGDHYHELHFSYWTLKRLCKQFRIVSYSAEVVADPDKYGTDYMIRKGSLKWRLARFVAQYMPWVSPAMWVLQKPVRNGR